MTRRNLAKHLPSCHPDSAITDETVTGNTANCTLQTNRPENTLLYQLVERHYPEFKEALSQQEKQLLQFAEREFDDFLRCGRLEHGFLRVVCGD